MIRRTAAAFLLVVLTAAAIARDGDVKSLKAEPPKEAVSRRNYSVTINGKKIDYEATAGTMLLKEEDGKPTASIFYVAYTKHNIPAAERPLTFCFNGGPGSSSVWLHLGAFGPRRVLLSDEGEALPPPARLVENAWSILDLTDLVFIDPVSTGYSRAVEEKNAKQC
jgi:carboxypeptidase C (cathepsin A)